MADINVQRKETDPPPPDDYTMGEVAFWLIGILSIPLIPILMIIFFTPWSGM